LPNEQEIFDKFGLNENGKVQRVVDTSFIHHMRLKMPYDSEMMIANTRNPKGGVVTVETPYAHYMNEGIKYVDPQTGKGAFYNESYGFWSRPNTKKVPSNDPLNYHSGPNRGAHFVERTISEDFNEIVKEAQEELDRL
jgi:hypothetical protein